MSLKSDVSKEACTTDAQKYTQNTQNVNNVIMYGNFKLHVTTTVTFCAAIDRTVLSLILLGEFISPHGLEVYDN